MSPISFLRGASVWLATAGLCLPVQLAAAQPPIPTPTPIATQPDHISIHDVALQPGGLLTGQLVDENLRPIADAKVSIQADQQTVAVTRTDASGAFAVAGLRGGVHQIIADSAIETCRLWSPGTAPPRAVDRLRVVRCSESVVRAQMSPPPMVQNFVRTSKRWATNPFIFGSVVAAAVAIPVALHNADKDRSGS